MNDPLKWQCAAGFLTRKKRKEHTDAACKLLRENERDYVGACGRFLSQGVGDNVWFLCSKTGGPEALLISSGSVLMPVFAGIKEIPYPEFLGNFIRKKKVHSIQGPLSEVKFLEKVLDDKGMKTKDTIDYDLMSLDVSPKIKTSKTCPGNLELRVPQMKDVEGLAPLQEGYEKEEVLPKGSFFNPASSRLNTANIVKNGKILAARIDGKFVGKINVNAVSFTRYQIGGVYVRPEFRRMGIACEMAGVFIASLINQGRGVTLFVKKVNFAAANLYRDLGFTSVGDYRITYY